MSETERCDKCGNQTIAAHSLTLDGARKFWRFCCLCVAELISELDSHRAASQ